MTWQNLNKDNIEDIKQLYICYLKRYDKLHSDSIDITKIKKYGFEDFIKTLQECPICNEYNEDHNMTYHKWDIGEVEEQICVGCRDNE